MGWARGRVPLLRPSSGDGQPWGRTGIVFDRPVGAPERFFSWAQVMLVHIGSCSGCRFHDIIWLLKSGGGETLLSDYLVQIAHGK